MFSYLANATQYLAIFCTCALYTLKLADTQELIGQIVFALNVLGVLGDEIHFLLACPTFNCDREPLMYLVNEKCGNFAEMDDFTKFSGC